MAITQAAAMVVKAAAVQVGARVLHRQAVPAQVGAWASHSDGSSLTVVAV